MPKTLPTIPGTKSRLLKKFDRKSPLGKKIHALNELGKLNLESVQELIDKYKK